MLIMATMDVINSIAVTVDPNETDTGNDFVETQLGAVTGNVSADTTGDELGNVNLEGVTLTLVDSDNNEIATTTTNASTVITSLGMSCQETIP